MKTFDIKMIVLRIKFQNLVVCSSYGFLNVFSHYESAAYFSKSQNLLLLVRKCNIFSKRHVNLCFTLQYTVARFRVWAGPILTFFYLDYGSR